VISNLLRLAAFLLAMAAPLLAQEKTSKKSTSSESSEHSSSAQKTAHSEKAKKTPPAAPSDADAAPERTTKSDQTATVVTPLDADDLADFEENPPEVRALLEACLPLTHQNLGYKFGSSDPTDGGMDCSGTIFYVLRAVGIHDVPRTASDQYVWARKADNFEAVVSRKKDSFELDELRPGDLLFWTGTYATDRDPPVTHTMIYLGKLKSDGRQVMFGSSDGRTYGGKKMWGVSVFDFTIPKAKPKPAPGEAPPALGSVFIGYAKIPGLGQAPKKSDE
jgi:peptidoglycan DL-endopeptidase CwlO